MPSFFLACSDAPNGMPTYRWVSSADSAAYFTHRLDAMLASSTALVTTHDAGPTEIKTSHSGPRLLYYVEMSLP
jgi:hypothetical protein